MQINKEYVREIRLRDLFFHILYRWRSILIAALIGAVLLGGYTWINNRNKSAKTGSAGAVQTNSNTAPGFLQSNYEASNQLYQSLLENNEIYRSNSVVMKVDPYKVWKATTVYAVVLEDIDSEVATAYNPAIPIVLTYPSIVFDSLDVNRLKDIYEDADLNYINEVVTAAALSNAGSFSVTSIGLTKEMAEKAQAYLCEVVQKTSLGEVQQMRKHRIVQLSCTVRQVVDTDIEARQAAIAKNIATYQGAITSNDTAIDKAPSGKKSTGGTNKKSRLKYAAVGFAFSAFFLICIYGVIYLFSGKIRSAGELTERFGVPIYGELNHSRARRPGKGVDGLIEKWEFRKNKTDRGTVLDNICALIRERVGNGCVLLTGTLSANRMQAISNSLSERLDDSVKLLTEGSFLNNNSAVEGASEASAVIILEEKHISEANEIRRMLEMLNLGKTPVIGAIVA